MIEGALRRGATDAKVRILIDGPDELTARRGNTFLAWTEHFQLEFPNGVSVERMGDTVRVFTADDQEDVAELWRLAPDGAKELLIGTYHMPFELHIVEGP